MIGLDSRRISSMFTALMLWSDGVQREAYARQAARILCAAARFTVALEPSGIACHCRREWDHLLISAKGYAKIKLIKNI